MSQHGTLKQRNGNAVLVGDYYNPQEDWFHFQIDGSKNTNGFLKSEWDFVPDVVLPTEDGIYVRASTTDPGLWGAGLYQLHQGKWTSVYYSDTLTVDYMEKQAKDGPLKRLVMEEA